MMKRNMSLTFVLMAMATSFANAALVNHAETVFGSAMHFSIALSDGDQPYDVVEKMPQFPGGQAELFKFISENMKYPVDAQKKKIQGRVILSFVVNEDGSISNVNVVKKVYPSLDAEAIRVLKMMPKWQPGYQDGKAVKVRYVIPMTFKLD
jgi:protein TonB